MFECIQFKFVFHCTLDVYFVVKLIFLFMVQPRIMELKKSKHMDDLIMWCIDRPCLNLTSIVQSNKVQKRLALFAHLLSGLYDYS
jgi:hypothetical protein